MSRIGFPDRTARPEAVVGFWLLHGVGYGLLLWAIYPTLAHVDANSAEILQHQWRLIYQSRNPPLYEWLVRTAEMVTGIGPASFLLVRYVLMAGLGIATFDLVRRRSGSRQLGAAASYGLLTFYWFAWFAHESASHTILVALIATVFLRALTDFLEEPGLARGALLGLVAGVGLIAKFNFAILLVLSLIVVVSHPMLRRRVLNSGSLSALLIAATISAPIILAVLTTPGMDLGLKAAADHAMGEGSHLMRSATAAVHMPVSLILFLAPWVLMAAWTARHVPAMAAVTPGEIFLARLAVLGPVLGYVAVVGAGITALDERYMLPLAVAVPIWFHAVRLRAADPDLTARRFAAAGLLALILCLVIRSIAVLGGPISETSDNKRLDPYPTLAQELAGRGLDKAFFIAGDRFVAGNLVSFLPGAHAVSLDSQKGYLPMSFRATDRCVLLYRIGYQIGSEAAVETGDPAPITAVLPSGRDFETLSIINSPTLIGMPRLTLFGLADLGTGSPLCTAKFGPITDH